MTGSESDQNISEKEAWVVNQLIKQIAGKGRLDDILTSLVEKTLDYIGVDGIALWLIDKSRRVLDPYWISDQPVEQVRRSGRGLISLDDQSDIGVICITRREPQICYDVKSDPRLNPEVVKLAVFSSFAIFPLLVDQEAIGFIGFTNYDPNRKIEYQNLAKFQRFVDTLSLFFHNAKLYDELETWNHSLEEKVLTKTKELKDAHDAIWTMKENLAGIIENTTSGIVATDPNGNLLVFNKSAATIFRGSMQNVPGHHILSLFPESGRADLAQLFAQSKTGQESIISRNVETMVKALDGSPVVTRFSAVRLFDREKRLQGLLFVFHDLREIRFLESQVIQGEKLKLLGEMAAGVSHEINTPLGMIKGSLACIRRDLPISHEEVLNHVELIEDAVQRSCRFVNDLLSFSRPKPYFFSTINVPELVTRSVEISRLKFHHFPLIQFEKTFEENLPTLYGDLEKLSQVLVNILNNAVDASGATGRVQVTVQRKVARLEDIIALTPPRRKNDPDSTEGFLFRQPQNHHPRQLAIFTKPEDVLVEISISDNGIGIPAEVQERMFEPFYSTKSQTGTGLGLAIALSIIKRHHGAIRVVSDVGKGTTISILFPIQENTVHFERNV
jgi:PAS domain S-box-containing protein